MSTKTLILFLKFAIAIRCAGSAISIPAGYNRQGSPFVNFTISGVGLPSNFTLPMTVQFVRTNVVGFPRIPETHVELRLRDNGLMPLTDPMMHFQGGSGPESVLAIGTRSWIRNSYGSIAFTGDSLILNASRDDFISSCIPESYLSTVRETQSTTRLDRSTPVFDGYTGFIRDGHDHFHAAGVHYELRPLQNGMIGSIPDDLFRHIESILLTHGARRSERNAWNPLGVVVSNCFPGSLTELPSIIFGFGSSGELVLTPEDYISMNIERNECSIRFRAPAPAAVPGYYSFNPFMIKGLNFRISNDFLEVCDSL